VSRERIGKELEGMLKSSRPDMAFNYLHELALFDIVFELPKNYGTCRVVIWMVDTK